MRAKADQLYGPDDVTADEFAARLAIGFDAYFTDWLLAAIDAQYVRPTGDLKEFDYISISVGLQFRF